MDEILEGFKEKGSVLVAFSGGVDSSVLAALAFKALGEKAVAVTLMMECSPAEELENAKRIAREIGIEHRILDFSQFAVPGFKENPEERCYLCKKAIAKFLKLKASELGVAAVCDGVNLSDLDDYRPGIKASDEEGIWHPLLESGLRKEDIKKLARELGLSNADSPSSACLASRFAVGVEIEKGAVKRIDKAEEFLRRLGLRKVRVRIDAERARIESSETEKLLKLDLKSIKAKLSELGFDKIYIDLGGYRPGGEDSKETNTGNGENTGDKRLLQI